MLLVCSFQILVRWSLPRFRYDQLLRFAWKFMFPLALANLVGHGRRGLGAGPRVKARTPQAVLERADDGLWWERVPVRDRARAVHHRRRVPAEHVALDHAAQGRAHHLLPRGARADYAPHNRGKHVLTQRPDGRPQCIACNMCATVCPAKVIEIEAAFDPDDPAHPKYPARFEIDYSRCIFCGLCVEACPEDAIRMVKDVPDLPVRPPRHVARHGRAPATGIRSATSRKPYPPRPARDGRGPPLIETRAPVHRLRRRGARRRAAMLVLRQPMRVALALIATMLSLAGDLRAARRARHRRVPGADLRRRGDGLHGLRDHAARRARSVVTRRYSRLLVPGVAARCALSARSATACGASRRRCRGRRRGASACARSPPRS